MCQCGTARPPPAAWRWRGAPPRAQGRPRTSRPRHPRRRGSRCRRRRSPRGCGRPRRRARSPPVPSPRPPAARSPRRPRCGSPSSEEAAVWPWAVAYTAIPRKTPARHNLTAVSAGWPPRSNRFRLARAEGSRHARFRSGRSTAATCGGPCGPNPPSPPPAYARKRGSEPSTGGWHEASRLDAATGHRRRGDIVGPAKWAPRGVAQQRRGEAARQGASAASRIARMASRRVIAASRRSGAWSAASV